ncbi:MAG: bifunctional phosphoribosyl-AMP cyclohydrolase/phosphoribosyl-ATP diphosphatase HisIE [Dehalococcoidia bacterium]|nr:bifunctional phosphoribosyl-AMP cyclohydrolase/phosphoribosyl-ATP diphosphatase HisIE [Dehalococcoidia bacterium]
MTSETIDELTFDAAGLIPAIVQDCRTKQVLMLAYMNRESLLKTLETGKACYWSRSRRQLWTKGETSGNYQLVKDIAFDCDKDALLVTVEQIGVACHTGARSCFDQSTGEEPFSLDQLYDVLIQRKESGDPEKSYTARLMTAGVDRILKKVAEEAGEVIIASKNDSRGEIIHETADLWFHSLMVLAYHGIKPEEIIDELARRRR